MKRQLYILTALFLAMTMSTDLLRAQGLRWHSISPGPQWGIPMQDHQFFRKRRTRRHVEVRVGEHLSQAKMWMMVNELDLTESQTAKLFPRMKDHQKEMDKLTKDRVKLMKQFHVKVDDEKASTKDTERFVDELSKLEKQRVELKNKFIKSMKDVLKPDQFAQFAVFEERSMGKLRRRLSGSDIFIDLHGNFDDEDDD